MASIDFNCMATMIGSVPYEEPDLACKTVNRFLKEWPAWPQMPRRSNLESMYVQFTEGFPGLIIKEDKVEFERPADIDRWIEKVFIDSQENNYSSYSIGNEYAAGFHYCINHAASHIKAIKGQITGPVSLGLCITDANGQGVVYDDVLAEALARFLKLKASWQEAKLRKKVKNTCIFIDEPYLTSLGSAFIALSTSQISSLINEVLSGIKGLKGLHCCGSTDWSMLLKLPIDIISFDSYSYLDSFICYPDEISSFLKKGKAIAWGIVPNDEEKLEKETPNELFDRLCESINKLVSPDFAFKDVLSRSIITPSCGLAYLDYESTEYVLSLLGELSGRIRKKYCQ